MAALNLSTVVEVMEFTEIQLEIKMATILHYIQHSSRVSANMAHTFNKFVQLPEILTEYFKTIF